MPGRKNKNLIISNRLRLPRKRRVLSGCKYATYTVAGGQQVRLLPEQPEQQGQDDTDEDARSQRKVEGEVLPLDDDVSGQLAKPADPVCEQDQQSCAGEAQPGDQKDCPQRRHREILSHFPPKTVFRRSVTRAAGFVRIFFSSCPTMKKRPSSDLFVTYWSRASDSRFMNGSAVYFPIISL